jgi:5'-3' exoribonuclease 2
MGVFPPARYLSFPSLVNIDHTLIVFYSKKHIPAVFHPLMTEEDSPIIDFYPEAFEIDMNGKKMIWQGVALLPFIDEKRLLDAMAEPYTRLTEDEIKRNGWGSNALFVGEDHPLYPVFESLYGKRKNNDVRWTACL